MFCGKSPQKKNALQNDQNRIGNFFLLNVHENMSTLNNGKHEGNYVLEMLVKHVGDVHCEIMQTNTSYNRDIYPNIDKGNHRCNIFSIRQDNLW